MSRTRRRISVLGMPDKHCAVERLVPPDVKGDPRTAAPRPIVRNGAVRDPVFKFTLRSNRSMSALPVANF